MATKKKQPTPSPEIVRQRTPDFANRYANYSHLQGSLWDLRMAFGQAEGDPKLVPIHTNITMPWPQAKVLAYFLQLHVAGYESDNGRIKIPAGIIPRVSEKSLFHNLYQQFIADNPEAAAAATTATAEPTPSKSE